MVPLPDWNGLHPLVIHFPIALLVVAPLLVLIGLLVKGQRPFLSAALLLMALGTLGTWVAVATGEAAGQLADRAGAVGPLLERHEELAETTRSLFTVLTLVFAALQLTPRALRREPSRRATLAAHALFLALYAFALTGLARTAHQGGLLVHQQGVHALTAPEPQPATAALDDDSGHR
jgi:uncharacterized membrane protein